MILWGGYFSDGNDHFLNTGGRYRPGTDSWTATSTTNAPTGRSSHTAVWTGSEMIVWGGQYGPLNIVTSTGGRYCASVSQFRQYQDARLCADGRQRGDCRVYCARRANNDGDYSCHRPRAHQYGVPNPLANPTLELHDGTGALIASNDSWQNTIIGGDYRQNQVPDIRDNGTHPPMEGNLRPLRPAAGH